MSREYEKFTPDSVTGTYLGDREMHYTVKRSEDPDTIEIWYIWKDERFLAAIIHTDLFDDDIKAEIDANGEADIEFKLIGREK